MILFLVGDPKIYGSGHFLRCKIICKNLSDMGVKSRIHFFPSQFSFAHVSEAKLIVFDVRDEEIPLIARECFTIAMDNRGTGRTQANLVLDALPHFSMNGSQFLNSLSLVTLSPLILQYPNHCDKATIKTIEKGKALREQTRTFSPLARWPRMSKRNYAAALKKFNTVRLYFGQSLFEAIYMGKNIELYSISDYHGALARWIEMRWRGLCMPKLYFDGKGSLRLAKIIFDEYETI